MRFTINVLRQLKGYILLQIKDRDVLDWRFKNVYINLGLQNFFINI